MSTTASDTYPRTIPASQVRVGDTIENPRTGRSGVVAGLRYDRPCTAQEYALASDDEDVTLLARPAPTLPTHPGAVILASEVRGVTFDPPVALLCTGVGDWTRQDGALVAGYRWHASEDIAAWQNAKIVAVTE